ncbi:alpha/beta hydrolase [Undibacterium sp. RuTC16W]|uniref:alpha/beta hydrolase n=1 Tax=Undibacterium sp. RuTC16W TaxID=3413048 RepID=UPI003BF36E02
MRIFTFVVSILALAYFLLCAGIFFYQRSLIYYPQQGVKSVAENTIWTRSGEANIHIAVRKHEGNDAIIYFGGNAEDVVLSLPDFSEIYKDRAIYLMHYRGYGGSTGAPSEDVLHKDALTLFDQIYKKHTNVIVIGRSLGTGVAVRLASQRPVSRLILITPYDSLESVAASQFPYLPVHWLLKDRFDSGVLVPKLKMPTLILMAELDEVIPKSSTEQLYSRFSKGVASIKTIQGASHNTISANDNYSKALKEFR